MSSPLKVSIPSIAELVGPELGVIRASLNLPADEDFQGWNSDSPVFDRLVEETDPATIIQVGAWKGRSTAHLAMATAGRTEIDGVSGVGVPAPSHIYDVDTWLGGIDHVLSTKPQDNLLRDSFGSPRLYHQYIRNFVGKPAASRIHPIQNTSLNGARLLAAAGIRAKLIYIDGSHEYEDAYADMSAYRGLLAPGGIMFGDDFRNFPGVFAAVVRFAHEQNLNLKEEENNFWILRG